MCKCSLIASSWAGERGSWTWAGAGACEVDILERKSEREVLIEIGRDFPFFIKSKRVPMACSCFVG